MPRDLIVPAKVDRRSDGKAMALLGDQQRAFVMEMLARGTAKKACVGAAKAAGYNPQYGWELLRNDDILAAMREETTKRLSGAALIGVNVIIDIAREGEKEETRLKAAIKLAELTGYTAEQKIVVEHVDRDTRAQVNRVIVLAGNLGLDAKTLLLGAGLAIDGEFTEVADGE